MILALFACGWLTSAPSPEPIAAPAAAPKTGVPPRSRLPFRALPIPRALTLPHLLDRIELGERLFSDPRLGERPCSGCHPLDRTGTSGEPSVGHTGQPGPLDPPSVFNSAQQEAQFHDGRAPTVEDASRAIPGLDGAVEALKRDPELVAAFEAAFPYDDPSLTAENAGTALGAYLRRLLTRGPFDRYLEGDDEALGEDLHGLAAFMEQGCARCHLGPGLGGNVEQGKRITMLRNVTRTGPWMHDGQAGKLDDAIQHDHPLDAADRNAILGFLKRLEGTNPSQSGAGL